MEGGDQEKLTSGGLKKKAIHAEQEGGKTMQDTGRYREKQEETGGNRGATG